MTLEVAFTKDRPAGKLPARYSDAFFHWFEGRNPDGSLRLPTVADVRKDPERHLENLRAHLQGAMQVELFTLPPYLTAYLSIPDQTNLWPAYVLRSVLMEEMLHMSLAANTLSAVGGTPILDDPAVLVPYPSRIPFSGLDLEVHLAPLSPRTLEVLRAVEIPEQVAPKNPPKDFDAGFTSLSEYYFVVESMLQVLHEAVGPDKLFCGDPKNQLPLSNYYGGGGRLVDVVEDLPSALMAINEISRQGEGGLPMDPSKAKDVPLSVYVDDPEVGERDVPTHYFRFDELIRGRKYRRGDEPYHPTGDALEVDWSVIKPMKPDPRRCDFDGHPEIARAVDDFDATFTRLLSLLHKAFNGEPGVFRDAVAEMYKAKYQGQALMNVPHPGADGMTVGPTFEWSKR